MPCHCDAVQNSTISSRGPLNLSKFFHSRDNEKKLKKLQKMEKTQTWKGCNVQNRRQKLGRKIQLKDQILRRLY